MNGLNKSPDELLIQAAEAGLDSYLTGRQIITFREGATQEGLEALRTSEVSVARASDFNESAVEFAALEGAGMVVFEELGVALVSGDSPVLGMSAATTESVANNPIVAIEPETFVYAEQHLHSYLEGFAAAVERIRSDLAGEAAGAESDLDAQRCWPKGAQRRLPDHRRGRQRQRASGSYRACRRTGQLADDRLCRGAG
jgi:hypothetical protein